MRTFSTHVITVVTVHAIERVDLVLLRGDSLGGSFEEAYEANRFLGFCHAPSCFVFIPTWAYGYCRRRPRPASLRSTRRGLCSALSSL